MGEKRGLDRGGLRILVVDDDEAVLTAHKRFGARDRQVLTAATPSAAIDIARAQPTLDLAIVDLRIGKATAMLESGIEVVRAVKKLHPSCTVALVSGYLSVETAVLASRSGADLVKFKPCTIPELLDAATKLDKPDDETRPSPPITVETPSLARAEWEHLHRVLADTHGNVSEAARRLRIFRTSLQRKLKKAAPRA
jgi:two-component system response regulator RegA